MRVRRRRRPPIQYAAHVSGTEASAPGIEEKGVLRRTRPGHAGPAAARPRRSTACGRGFGDGHPPLLGPLAPHRGPTALSGRRPPVAIPHSSLTRNPLPYSSSSTASSRKRTSAATSVARAGGRSRMTSSSPRGQHSGEPAIPGTGGQADGGVGSQRPVPPQPTEVAAQGRRPLGDALAGIAPRSHVGQVPAQHQARDLLGAHCPAPLGPGEKRPGPVLVRPPAGGDRSVSDMAHAVNCHRAPGSGPGGPLDRRLGPRGPL